MEFIRGSWSAFDQSEVTMSATTFLVIAAVMSVAAAGVSYYSAVQANKKAEKAADERNDQLRAQYDAQAAGESKKFEAKQRRLSYERHLKSESVAASMASAGIVTTTGSAGALKASVDNSYRVAQLESADQQDMTQNVLYNNLLGGMAETNQAYQSAIQNPLLTSLTTGLKTGAAMMQIGGGLSNMGAFTSTPGAVVGTSTTLGTASDASAMSYFGQGESAYGNGVFA